MQVRLLLGQEDDSVTVPLYPDTPGPDRMTALHYAARYGRHGAGEPGPEVVAALLEAGARSTARDRSCLVL